MRVFIISRKFWTDGKKRRNTRVLEGSKSMETPAFIRFLAEKKRFQKALILRIPARKKRVF